jgi:hypothetical protein
MSTSFGLADLDDCFTTSISPGLPDQQCHNARRLERDENEKGAREIHGHGGVRGDARNGAVNRR